MKEEVVVVLKNARLLIEGGWTKRALRRLDPQRWRFQYCLVGAVMHSIPDDFEALHAQVRAALLESLDIDPISTRCGTLADWNDRWYRTKGSVLRLLNRTIKRLEEQKV